MRTWTRAGGMEPLDPDSEPGKQRSREFTVACLEVRAAIAQRRRVAELEQHTHAA